jgi:hypothetical protein
MVKLTASQRNQLMCAAQRLRINSRDTFFRAVNRILSTCPQPITNNDMLRACDLAMEIIPTQDVIVSRSNGPTNDVRHGAREPTTLMDDYYEQIARRY